MSSFIYKQEGHTIVIYIARDGLVIETIENEMKKNNIKHGVLVSCIGTLQLAKMHFNVSKEETANDKFFEVDGPIEFAAAQSLIIDGHPHIHAVLANADKTYAGHLEYGSVVQNLMEIVILEIPDLDVVRKKNSYGIAYLDKP